MSGGICHWEKHPGGACLGVVVLELEGRPSLLYVQRTKNTMDLTGSFVDL